MENYIVRIYRRDDELEADAGIVEIVERQEEKLFKSVEELYPGECELSYIQALRTGSSQTIGEPAAYINKSAA